MIGPYYVLQVLRPPTPLPLTPPKGPCEMTTEDPEPLKTWMWCSVATAGPGWPRSSEELTQDGEFWVIEGPLKGSIGVL